jgi:bleomycin hydrolase
VPESFKWEGKEYTPRSFADNYLDLHANEYLQFTSFTHHPFYQEMMIEVPDNWFWGTSWNLPLDEFMSLVDVSLEKGYTLAWATDVSEKGFSIRNGFAINPDYKQLRLLDIENPFIPGCPELNVDAVLRQKSFDNWETTDDHGMQIIGKVRDQNGKVYYTVRNSWGEIPNPYKPGYLYASESFIKHKSISFVVHKDILPKAIAKKLDL